QPLHSPRAGGRGRLARSARVAPPAPAAAADPPGLVSGRDGGAQGQVRMDAVARSARAVERTGGDAVRPRSSRISSCSEALLLPLGGGRGEGIRKPTRSPPTPSLPREEAVAFLGCASRN